MYPIYQPDDIRLTYYNTLTFKSNTPEKNVLYEFHLMMNLMYKYSSTQSMLN